MISFFQLQPGHDGKIRACEDPVHVVTETAQWTSTHMCGFLHKICAVENEAMISSSLVSWSLLMSSRRKGWRLFCYLDGKGFGIVQSPDKSILPQRALIIPWSWPKHLTWQLAADSRPGNPNCLWAISLKGSFGESIMSCPYDGQILVAPKEVFASSTVHP